MSNQKNKKSKLKGQLSSDLNKYQLVNQEVVKQFFISR